MRSISGERGVGLVEVLVAVLLLSVAVLGFSALQLRAVSATDESLVRTQAMSIIRGLSEDMRSNADYLEAYQDAIDEYNAGTLSSKDCDGLESTCSPEEMVKNQAKSAADRLESYGIAVEIMDCPIGGKDDENKKEEDKIKEDASPKFYQIKCIVAAWGDTEPDMAGGVNSCASSDGNYKSGKSCIIVEAY